MLFVYTPENQRLQSLISGCQMGKLRKYENPCRYNNHTPFLSIGVSLAGCFHLVTWFRLAMSCVHNMHQFILPTNFTVLFAGYVLNVFTLEFVQISFIA